MPKNELFEAKIKREFIMPKGTPFEAQQLQRGYTIDYNILALPETYQWFSVINSSPRPGEQVSAVRTVGHIVPDKISLIK
jgi:hypothetical protein